MINGENINVENVNVEDINAEWTINKGVWPTTDRPIKRQKCTPQNVISTSWAGIFVNIDNKFFQVIIRSIIIIPLIIFNLYY